MSAVFDSIPMTLLRVTKIKKKWWCSVINVLKAKIQPNPWQKMIEEVSQPDVDSAFFLLISGFGTLLNTVGIVVAFVI